MHRRKVGRLRFASSRSEAPELQNDPSLSPRSGGVSVGPAAECFMGLISATNGVFGWNGPLQRRGVAQNSSKGENVQSY